MRVDKFLKVSRILKRRTVANDAAKAGRVRINGKEVKPSAEVSEGDVLEIGFGDKAVKVRVTKITNSTKKEDAADMFEAL